MPIAATRAIRLTSTLAAALYLIASKSALASSASLQVNVPASLGTVPPGSAGVNMAAWDGLLLDAPVSTLLSQAGVRLIRYPGGSSADIYHWQTNSATTGSGGWFSPNANFDDFMSVATAAGAGAIITVNYGSNAAGTGGGDPNEAAAWVDYANNQKGYNVQYWEVGNEVYGNGEYGSRWEEDLHSAHDPTTYGDNVVQFAQAMKAKDANIKVGAVLCAPGNWPDGISPDWNSNVLAACGTSIDFVIVHWYAQEPGSETDASLLGSTSQIAGMASKVRSLVNQYCGSNASHVQIFVTETNSVSYNPGKQSVSLVNALFLADDAQTWLENGVANVDLWDLHNGPNSGGNNSSSLYGSATYGDYGMLSVGASPEPAADTPFPDYFALQILSRLEGPGDSMVPISCSSTLLGVHAVRQSSGSLALLLVNKDPSNSCSVSVNLTGFYPASTATVAIYGEGSTALYTSTINDASTSFKYTAAPYSMSLLLLSPGPYLSGLSPGSIDAGSPTFKLVAKGESFQAGDTIDWSAGGVTTPLVTTYVSSFQLSASVPASLVKSPGKASVAVARAGGLLSQAKQLTILTTTLKMLSPSVTVNSSTGGYVVGVTLKNVGYLTANKVQITSTTLGGAATSTALPVSMGAIGPGHTATITLQYPAGSGSAGAKVALSVVGKFTGGTLSGKASVTLP